MSEPKGFRSRVAALPENTFYLNTEIKIKLPNSEIDYTVVGLTPLYNWIFKEFKVWEQYDLVAGSVLQISKDRIRNLKTSLENMVAGSENSQNFNAANYYNSNIKPVLDQLSQSSMVSASDPAVEFLNYLEKGNIDEAKAAFQFLYGSSINLGNSPRMFTGAIKAYEFKHFEDSLYKRHESDSRNFQKLKAEIDRYIASLESSTTNHISEASKKISNHSTEIDTFKEENIVKIRNLIRDLNDKFDVTRQQYDSKFEVELKKYKNLLQLKQPADYWMERAKKMKDEAIQFTIAMGVFIVVVIVLLTFLLWQTPEGMLFSFAENTSFSIKWSVAFLGVISICIFAIRVFHRLAISAYHLARDAEEKHQLTYVYLSLIDEAEVDTESKHLILQSLFSRADSGLLKDEHGPTMPSTSIIDLLKNK